MQQASHELCEVSLIGEPVEPKLRTWSKSFSYIIICIRGISMNDDLPNGISTSA